MAFGLDTYQDTVRREDLIDVITDVSPDSNPLSTMLARTTASQTLHEWPIDHISRPTSVSGAAEGATATYADLTQPSRVVNVTQIITQTFRVSGTERKVSTVTGDALDYQAAKALREWKNKQEYALIRGVVASGSSGIARQMAGIQAAVTSHWTGRSSGTSLSETEFNAMVKDVWDDVGEEDVFDLVLVPMGLKQKISTFTAGSTRYVPAEDRRLTRPVMVYESDGGVHRIMAHKDVNNAAGTVAFLGLKEDKFKIAYLRLPVREALSKDGDRDNGQIVGEMTLEHLAQRASVQRTGYSQSG